MATVDYFENLKSITSCAHLLGDASGLERASPVARPAAQSIAAHDGPPLRTARVDSRNAAETLHDVSGDRVGILQSLPSSHHGPIATSRGTGSDRSWPVESTKHIDERALW